MKIALANLHYDEAFANEEELLRTYYTNVGWAEALQRAGAQVTVINRFSKDSHIQLKGVEYIFINDGLPGKLGSLQIPWKFLTALAALDVEIVHLHEFTRSPQMLVLRSLLNRRTGIVIQHHGGRTKHDWKMGVHNTINNRADGYFFSSGEQGLDWFKNKRQASKVMPVMEGATFFDFDTRDAERTLHYQDRQPFRQLTGMSGDPVFLWVGRLDANKDPLTVLQGFELLLQSQPNATLYMIYGESHLELQVREMIEDSDGLKAHVQLLGRIPHEDLEPYYNSADYFVLGSHYEGSSFSLSEALSCGCIPIVTDIPSLRMMTNEGQLGALWQPGDKSSFVGAAMAALQKAWTPEAEACIEFYRNHLSFDAIARIALIHYQNIVQQRLSAGA